MFETYQKCEEAHLQVQIRANEKGFIVSRPTMEARYDMVIDTGDELWRAQVKYAGSWNRYGALELDLRKETRNNGKKKVYQEFEVDVLLIYVPRPFHKVLKLDGPAFHGKKGISIRPVALHNSALMRGTFLLDEIIW